MIPKRLSTRGGFGPRILPRPNGREGRREERPPQRLDISRRGRRRAAPGLNSGAYLWRRPRQGASRRNRGIPPAR